MILTTQRGGWIRRAGGMGKRWKTDHERSQRADEEAESQNMSVLLLQGDNPETCQQY